MRIFQEAAEKQAFSILRGKASAAVTAWQKDYFNHFPHVTLSHAAQSFEEEGNRSVASALSATLNLVDQVQAHLSVLEQYITLKLPELEDRVGLGATVQQYGLDLIHEAREKILDLAVENLTQYNSSRADALEKCQLPTTIITESAVASKSEKKSISTTTKPRPDLAARQLAVLSVDLLYYSKAKTTYTRAITAYMAVVDFCDKNQEIINKE